MNKAHKLLLQEEDLKALTKQGEPQFTDTWFPYTSGEIGPYYIQSVVVEKDGIDYARAIDALCHLIKESVSLDFDAISGGESRDWDFSNPVAVALKKPHIKIYKDGKVLGSDIEGKRIVHVADLNNEGSSIRDLWYPTIEDNNGEMIHAFFYVDKRVSRGV